MLFFDAHCDILSAIRTPEELFDNQHHWDAQRALRNGPFIQVFSSFAGDKFRDNPKAHMEAQLKKGLILEQTYPERIKLIRNREELDSLIEPHCAEVLRNSENWEEVSSKSGGFSFNTVYGFLEAEGAEILGGSISEMERLYQLGLRVLTIVWNYDNEVCDSVAGQHIHDGLSEFGRLVIARAQQLGMLIDVSHSSDKALEDVVELVKKPITASHSNSRVLCPHRRNLTDDQMRLIARSGGVIGINFFPFFLEKAGNAELMDIIRHIEYVAALVGVQSVGIGSDFDGFNNLPRDMTGVEDLSRIVEALLKLNYSEGDVQSIMGLNFIRLMKAVL
ncbi:MAG: dipeptidase [Clostridia bacterium]|nr:dipeptidase [Clostridia bacterium]